MKAAGKIIAELEKRPKHFFLSVGYLSVILLGILDYYTTSDLSFLIFYLIPVFLVTYFVGMWAGLLMSLATTAVWFMANVSEFLRTSSTIIPFWNVMEKLCFFFIMTFLLSALKSARVHERELERLDPLTSLENRHRFLEDIQAEINRCRRYKRPFTFVLLDLEGALERAGGGSADKTLLQSAETLRKNLRDVDAAARLGGSEFALLLPDTGFEAGGFVLSKIQLFLNEVKDDAGAPMTVAFGAITYVTPIHTIDEMMKVAARLTAFGKSRGKNSITHRLFGEPGAPTTAESGK